jgi:hypothetical protein
MFTMGTTFVAKPVFGMGLRLASLNIDHPNCRKVCGGILEWHCWWVCD